jgi:hypothetical protein
MTHSPFNHATPTGRRTPIRNTMHKTRLTTAAILASATLGLSACGDDKSSSDASSGTTPATSAAAATTSSSASTADVGTAGANTTEVVAAANAFLDTLSADQRKSIVKTTATTTATSSWSNLPAALAPRQGLYLGELTAKQKTAALKLLSTALSKQGDTEAELVREADDYLGQAQANGSGGGPGASGGGAPSGAGGSTPAGGPPSGGAPGGASAAAGSSTGGSADYDGGNYFIVFYGEPSDTSKWLLQYTGHHLTYNITYQGDRVSFGPHFAGVEPISFKDGSKTIAPLTDEAKGFKDTLDALSADQLEQAKLDRAYDDLLLGAGKDGPFPTTPEGVTVSDLSQQAQDAITETIKAYVGDLAGDAAAAKVKDYVANYDKTAFSYTGGTDTVTEGFYARIDGPKVWIEISTQHGIVLSGTHYHSIYREEGADYGGA